MTSRIFGLNVSLMLALTVVGFSQDTAKAPAKKSYVFRGIEADMNAISDTVQTLVDLMSALEDNDDVQEVLGNFEISPELLERIGG